VDTRAWCLQTNIQFDGLHSYDAVRDIGMLVMLSSFQPTLVILKNYKEVYEIILLSVYFGLEAYEFTLLPYVTTLSVTDTVHSVERPDESE
jgi:hypothetical protein